MMKKLLLLAAMAAIALGASADGYKIEQVWNLQNPQAVTGLDRMEIRQGFGMNGKFYVNCKKIVVDTIDGVPTVTTAPIIYEIDQNGLTGVTFPGGKNCGIGRDEAGNIVVSMTQFPNSWSEGLRVINPETGDYIEFAIPEEAAIMGRCDFLGFAKGNLMEDGEIWLNGSTQGTSISHIAVAGGEVDPDNCYYMVGSGIVTTTSLPLCRTPTSTVRMRCYTGPGTVTPRSCYIPTINSPLPLCYSRAVPTPMACSPWCGMARNSSSTPPLMESPTIMTALPLPSRALSLS